MGLEGIWGLGYRQSCPQLPSGLGGIRGEVGYRYDRELLQ
jgi:hypothetical protein